MFRCPVFKSVLSFFNTLHKIVLKNILNWGKIKKEKKLFCTDMKSVRKSTVEHMEAMYSHQGRHETAVT